MKLMKSLRRTAAISYILLLSGIFQILAMVFPPSVFASSVSISGKAKVVNTGAYLDFTNYNSNVTVDSTSGNFSGYVFSEDLGWIDFGTEDNTQGPVYTDLSNGEVKGKAYVLNTENYIDFEANGSNVTVAGTTFSGYVFSQDGGWIDFADTGVSASQALVQLPSAYWKFDEGQGTTANDSSIYKNSGTLGGTTIPTWQTENQCVSGKCLFFDGSTSKVTGSKIITDVQTVAFWIRPNTIATQGLIDLDGGTHKINTNASGVISAAGFSSPTYYINGVSTATPTLVLNKWNYVEITTSTSFDSTATFTVGTDGTNFIKGYIDEFKTYSVARTAAQVKADFNSRSATGGTSVQMGGGDLSYLSQGLVGYWKMEETASPSLDSSGNGNSGTWVGSTTSAAGKYGNGTSLTGGLNRYISLSNSSTISPGSGNFTLSVWFKTSASYPDGGSGSGWIYGDYGSDTDNVINILIDGSNSNKIGGIFRDGSGNAISVSNQGSAVNNGIWHQAVWVKDGTTGRMYIDGTLIGSNTNTSIGTITTSDGTVPRIGAYPIENDEYFNGQLDELRFYNRALSPKEVSDLYNWAPGPVGYWKMEDKVKGASQTIVDSSSNANSGTTNGTGIDCTKSGKYGGACSFNGTDDYVSIGDVLDGNASMSWGAWIKANTFGNRSSIFKRVASSEYAQFAINTDASVIGCLQSADGSSWGTSITTSLPTTNTWHHVTCTNDGTTARMYIDGVQAGTDSTPATSLAASTESLNVGFGRVANGDAYFNGLIDDVKIYNYARTQKQIVSDMGGGGPSVSSGQSGGPIGYWKLDEGFGTGAAGAHNTGNGGSALNGTLSGATVPSWTNSGRFGKALSFNGTSAYVAMPSDASALKITSDLTLSAWINLTNTSSQHDIICKYTGTAATSAYCLYTDANGKLNMSVVNSTGPAIVTTTGTTTLSSSTWYHVMGVFSSANSVKLYINGVLDKTNTTSIPTTLQDPTTILDIGAENAGSNLFAGTIDEPKIYNYALTADEVKTEYNRGSSLVLGALGNLSTLSNQAAGQEYCVPGDVASCAAPVGRWDFEEGTGNSTNDTSGNGYSGTITGATYTSGKFGKGLNFLGGTNVVDTISSIAGIKTVSFWVYPTSTTANLIDLQTTPGTINISASSGTISATGFTTPTYYVNGVQTASPTLTANIWNHIEVTTGTAITGSAVRFGRISTTSLTGKLDAVRFFDYARSAAQVAWDYNRGAPVGYWKFNECQGSSANDSSGNSRTGTITIDASGENTIGTCTTSSTAWGSGATGKRNASLSLDGSDDYVTTAAFSPLSAAGQTTTKISWGGWFYPTTSAASKTLLEKASEFQLTTDSNSMPICGIYYSAAFHNSAAPTTALTLSAWNHVLCTYNGTNINTYLNGQLIKQSSETNNITAASSILYMGKTSGGANFYSGQIDDVRVYNYPLTTTQVQQVMNDGAINFGPSTGAP